MMNYSASTIIVSAIKREGLSSTDWSLFSLDRIVS